MNILLTGAEGFTGQPFAAVAMAAGHEVTALQSNLTDASAVKQEVTQVAPDAVVHLAAISFVGHADESAFYSVNVIGTMNLLAALTTLRQPPRKVLLASSANVYGNCEASPINESQAPAPVNHYAASKLAMEQLARTYFDRLPIVISRPFNYTGPGQLSSFVIPKIVAHFAQRAPQISLGNMHVEREYNDVSMVCAAYLLMLQHGVRSETYNVCSSKTHTLQQVMKLLAKMTGHTLRVDVNTSFVRASEVHRLCGDPAKLHEMITQKGLALPSIPLQETLERMLIVATAPSSH